MVNAHVKYNMKWLSPSPLWIRDKINVAAMRNGSFRQPAILRFRNDLFMDELLALTAHRPDDLNQWIARPETWREPMPAPPAAARLKLHEPVSKRSQRIARQTGQQKKNGAAGNAGASTADKIAETASGPLPLKLYQPAHQRFYLVAAALVCRRPGLPDRTIDSGKQEGVGFVMRRLFKTDPAAGDAWNPHTDAHQEYAFVNTPAGDAWEAIPVAERDLLAEGEERTPLFSIHFDESGRRRRLHAGLIPVGKREAYLAAPERERASGTGDDSDDAPDAPDPRRLLFDADVAAPWKALLEQAAYIKEKSWGEEEEVEGEEEDEAKLRVEQALEAKEEVLKSTREQIQTASWYILLDFADHLARHLPDVWEAVKGQKSKDELDDRKRALFDRLESAEIGFDPAALLGTGYNDSDVKKGLVKALIAIKENDAVAEKLEGVEEPYDRARKPESINLGWPSFLFPLADPSAENLVEALPGIDELGDLLEAALDEPAQPPPEIEAPRESRDKGEPWFVIRCVYERPNCGPVHPEVVSEPTEPFQMAPFFDPDAPARPVRIPMPVDISPAGLRKFKKNTTFMLSDMLCGKMKSIKKMTLGDLVLSVLPWPFHKSLPDMGKTGPCGKEGGAGFGMFCSLSIPIVTLAAFILLIIIVTLFNIFFNWLPYLLICLPIPGLKGKKK